MRQQVVGIVGAALVASLSVLPARAEGDLFVRHLQISAEQAALQVPRPDDTRALESRLAEAVMRTGNGRRLAAGLGALTADPALAAAAKRYSELMRDQAFFAHVSPSGETLAQRLPDADRWRYAKLGENLWSAQGALDWRAEPIARQTAEDWILSPSHRDNLLEPVYTVAGVGTAVAGDKVYVTMLYAVPQADPVLARRAWEYAEPPADLYAFSRTTEEYVLSAVNRARAERGAPPLTLDRSLDFNAREHARLALDAANIGSASSAGETVLRRVLEDQQGRIRRLSMAIWQGSGGLVWEGASMAASALESWRKRGDTMVDLLDPRFDRIGVGLETDGQRVYTSVLLSESSVNAATVRLGGAPLDTLTGENGGLHTRSGGQYITID